MLDELQRLALETVQLNKQALIFLPSRASAEKTAEDIAKVLQFHLPELAETVEKALSNPTKQCQRLASCITKGVAFHHAGLVAKQRELIEDEFRSGKVKIICATPTLAAGVSTPAFRVIIKSLKRFSANWGMDWIPVLEYLQMAGRAGRPEYEKFGEAIVIAKDEKEKKEIYTRYICGKPEEIYSKLAVEPVLRTHLLSLIATGSIRDEKSMKDFFSATFWAHQYSDFTELENIMNRMLQRLETWQFVTTGKTKKSTGEFIAARELEEQKTALHATQMGKRVSELYLDPLTARHLLDSLAAFQRNDQKKKQERSDVFPLLFMICHTLEMRPLLRIKSKEEEKIQEELNQRYETLLEKEPSAYDAEYEEFLFAFKTTLFLDTWIQERDEDYLLETFDVRPGEVRAKLEIADWLLYASEELGKLQELREAVRELRKLRLRVKYGAKEELLPLLKLKGIGRIRARKLFLHGIRDLGDIKKADLATVHQLLGKALAEDIKKQVGEETIEIPKGTRKGQVSLEKF
ncbi:MAG: helicase-related protein [Nanoarchaeota archaeon]|nr:helicase-related protein [Nanoarchaeota archaeon]